MARFEMLESKVGEVVERNGSFVIRRQYFTGHWTGDITSSVRHIQGLTGPETEVTTRGVEALNVVQIIQVGVGKRLRELKESQLQPVSPSDTRS